jgi:hypothetical protein
MIPAGNTETVDLVLDPSTNYYNLFIFNNTSSKRIIWYQSLPTYDYVLFSAGGSSACTITDSQNTCFAGENSVNPYSFDW